MGSHHIWSWIGEVESNRKEQWEWRMSNEQYAINKMMTPSQDYSNNTGVITPVSYM